MADSIYSTDDDSFSDSEQFGAFENQSCENYSFEKLFGESTGFYTINTLYTVLCRSYAVIASISKYLNRVI